MHLATYKTDLSDVTERAESRYGRITVTGRYHRLPRKLEDDYRVNTKVLGTGINGEVVQASRRGNTKESFAVKNFKLNGLTKEMKSALESEFEIFLGMDHPHVARLVDVYESDSKLSLVMECMTGGELFDRVKTRKRFSEKDAADAVYQMLLAVNYIHTHKIVHRDIKLENFLYEAPDSDHLKLIDFGFSKLWEPNTTMALSCGTLSYVAPEVLKKTYTKQCDLWSLGVVVFILLFGYMPFSGSEKETMKNIRDGKYRIKEKVWSGVSSAGQDFVKSLLVVDPNVRLTAEQAMAHTWIAQRAKNRDRVDSNIIKALTDFGQISTFRRACMSIMAWSLSNDERAKVRQAFLEIDTDQSGTISLNEFKQVLEREYDVTDATTLQAFSALDVSKDDEIHYSEFLAAMVSSRIALHDDLLKASFNRFDTDNSGYITVENLREVLGGTFEGNKIEQIMKEADILKDGRISYQEWIMYLRGQTVDTDHTDAAATIIDTELKASKLAPRLSRRNSEKVADKAKPRSIVSCCAFLCEPWRV